MNAAQIAQALNARRAGKGKWVAKCPAHADRTPSLSIAEGRKVPVVLRCMSVGCDTRDILAAAGLKWSDLFDGKPTPELKQRMSRERQKEVLERRLGLVIVLGAIEQEKRRYWAAAERRIRGEINELRCWLDPEKVIREWREQQFQEKVRRIGWDAIWKAFEASAYGQKIAQQYGRGYGVDGAGTSTGASSGKIRQERLYP